MKDEIVAVVQDIVQGKHGPYAVATSDSHPDINFTFSLEKLVWNEEKLPSKGTYVVLSDIQRKKAGWRAESARLYTLEDEKSSKELST